jgi:tRNA dimethylallyltransferase
MNNIKLPTVFFIGGATASGKTELSLKLAKELNGEIISADSRQIYIGMDIGTAKAVARQNPPKYTGKLYLEPIEYEGVNHYMIDVVYPNERFSLFDFKEKAYELIELIVSHGKTPIVVGGTGLYIDALIKNYQIDSENLPEDFKVRKEIEAEFQNLKSEIGEEKAKLTMHKRLEQVNYDGASKLHSSNIYAVLRELEFALINDGQTKSDSAKMGVPPFNYELIITDVDRKDLYKRIEDRIDLQINDGLIEETERLRGLYGLELPALTSLGYKEIAEYLQGVRTLEDAVLEFKKKTRNYAKRQLTWFRRYLSERGN